MLNILVHYIIMLYKRKEGEEGDRGRERERERERGGMEGGIRRRGGRGREGESFIK